jgi:Pyruvate/2-oxoacid:ferredoxin oxidoreductase delta subunit
MRLIDAERIPNDEFFKGMTDIEKAKVLQWFVSAPTVDAVKVVRCKNCIYRDGPEDTCGNIYCRLHDGRFDKDGYCSYGKEENEQ